MRHLPQNRLARILGLGVGLLLLGTMQSWAQARQADLTIKRDIVCTYPNFVDHQISTDTVGFVLPEIDGPVSGQGQYHLQGTGYVLAGISAGAGEVHGDSELVLTYGQWNYQGTWMNAEAPGVPTKAQPVTLPLEPGAQKTVSFQNAMAHEGASCSGTVIYQLDFQRETQIWDIALDGEREVLHKTLYSVVDPKTQGRRSLEYEHGVTFIYSLGARVTLERKAGAWHYQAGQVMLAKAKYRYDQSPKLYTIVSQSCLTCWVVDALAGQPIAGVTDGTVLNLEWPDIRPEVSLTSQFALQCAPGPEFSSCERAKKDTTNFADDDGDFMQRAAAHNLVLKDGPQNFDTGSDSAGVYFRVHHDYRLKRIK